MTQDNKDFVEYEEDVAKAGVDGLDDDVKHIIESFDRKKQEKLRLKIDYHLVPACAALYLFCFLDRGNIGNAKVAGMLTYTGMTSHQYSVILTVFFATYCPMEAPCNMLLKKISPKIFLPTIAFLWGICVLCMGFASKFEHFVVLRILLGLFESGLMPGCAYYLSNWYRASDVSTRIALYFSTATIAGAFSGILAWAIMKMEGVGGLHGWAWIFILEGLATIVVAVISYFFIYNDPQSAGFLSDEERIFWEWNLRQDPGKYMKIVDDDRLSKAHVIEGMLSWRVWYFVIMTFGITVPLYSFSYFLPTIIVNLGWSAATAQLMSAPPYIWACLTTLLNSWLSDHYKNRWKFIAGPMATFGVIGFVIAISSGNPGVGYGGVFIACAGQYSPWPNMIAWNSNNLPNSHIRGISIGVQIGFGASGGIISSFIFRPQDSPRYFLGLGLCLFFASLGSTMALALAWYLHRQNTKKEQFCLDHPEVYEQDSNELAKLGEKSPLFRYVL